MTGARIALGFGSVPLTGGAAEHELCHVLQRAVRLGALAVCGPVVVLSMRMELAGHRQHKIELLPAEPRPGSQPFVWFHVLSPIAVVPAGARLVLCVADVSTAAQRFPFCFSRRWPFVARRWCHVSAVCQASTERR